VSRELKYSGLSDEEAMQETDKRLKAMKQLLLEIRDALKVASGFE